MDLNILVVDDDDCYSGLFKAFLEYKKDWKLHIADSPTKAMVILKETSIDVIVSDLKMSPMNGMVFLSQVSMSFPKTVRILLTGQPINKLLPSYIHFQFEKGNFSIKDLVNKVNKQLED